MPRVTVERVAEIVGGGADPESMTPFLASASAVASALPVLPGGYAPGILAEIELWLAAHFYAVANPPLSSRTIGSSSEAYERGSPGKGYASTRYGQQAVALDYLGLLSPNRVTGAWLGTARRPNGGY